MSDVSFSKQFSLDASFPRNSPEFCGRNASKQCKVPHIVSTVYFPLSTSIIAANDGLVISHGQEDWEQLLQDVNASLNRLDFEFRALHDETTGRLMYTMV